MPSDFEHTISKKNQTLRSFLRAEASSRKAGLIFDLDGTLADSMAVWREIDIAFLAEQGLECDAAYLEMIRALRMHEAAIYTIERFGLELTADEIMQRWRDMAYSAYAEEIELKPYAREFLHQMRDAGYPMALCTASERAMVDVLLKRQGIFDFFPVIICATEHEKGKLEADVWELTMQKMGFIPEQSLVFEDTLASLRGAKKAGCRVLVMEDVHAAHEADQLKDEGDYYFRDFKELMDLLQSFLP